MIEARVHSVTERSESILITFDLTVRGVRSKLHALVDTGASNNFVRTSALKDFPPEKISGGKFPRELSVTLADGSKLRVPKRTAQLFLSFKGFEGSDEFILLDLNQKFDIILGMPWLIRHEPTINWRRGCLSTFKSMIERDLESYSESEDSHLTLISVGDETICVSECDGPADTDIQTLPGQTAAKPLLTFRSASSANRFAVLQEEEEDESTLPATAEDALTHARNHSSPAQPPVLGRGENS